MAKLNGWCIPKSKHIHVPLLNGYETHNGIQYRPARYWTKHGAYRRKDQVFDKYFDYPIEIMRTHTWFKPYQLFVLQTQAAKEFKEKQRRKYTELEKLNQTKQPDQPGQTVFD